MGGDFNLTVAVIGAACLVVMGLLAIRGERWNRRKVQPAVDPQPWIDERIAAERDPARRLAWRMYRDLEKEGQ